MSDALSPPRAAWRGQLPLWFTYWVLGVAGNMTFVAALWALYVIGGLQALAWLIAVYLLSLAWFVWIFGAVWRAAARYDGPRIWALLARAGVCVGVFRIALEAAVLAALASL